MPCSWVVPVPALTIYRLSEPFGGQADFDDFVQIPQSETRQEQTITVAGFQARLYVRPLDSKPPTWAPFLNDAFGVFPVAEGAAPSALLLLKLTGRSTAVGKTHGPYFALPFGPTGRFLIRSERIVRGYGLRTALNLIYPKNGRSSAARLRAIDSKRHGATVMRARTQASAQVDLEAFDVNQFRDLLDRATGTPASDAWGSTISGSDPISLNLDLEVRELGKICRKLDAQFHKPDYKDGFDWIDNVRAVTNLATSEALETRVVELAQSKSSDLHLAPAEMLDWSRIAGFQYRPDAEDEQERYPTQELRLSEYLEVLGQPKLQALSADYLRRARIAAVDGDGVQIKWSAWRCLVGEFTHDGSTYLLDEGRFFQVDKHYLSALNAFVDALNDDKKSDPATKVALPNTKHDVDEGDYNKVAARAADMLLLDRRTIGIPGSKSTIEICDLLSTSRRLIHVKRHLGSATLSHLFAQGLVSAELLQSSPQFRSRAALQVAKYVGQDGKDDHFKFFESATLTPSEFEVVYAIAEDWAGQSLAEKLPFFSKVNLREAASNLVARGFNVTVKQVHAQAAPAAAST